MVRQLIISSRKLPVLRPDKRVAQELGLTPGAAPTAAPLPGETPTPRRKPSEVSEEELVAALQECEWEQGAVAIRLGLPRSSVQLRMKHFHIRTAGELSTEEITRCHQECGGKLDEMVQRLKVSRQALRRRVKELGLELEEP
jgi:two-component system nitrogen regulation response regulator GlnG